MSVFDERAKEWDKKSRRVNLAGDVVASIIKYAKPEKGMKLADFGTGTGLIMLGLSDYASEMTGYDTSEGMLDVVRSKASEAGINNISVSNLDINNEEFPYDEYDMITCSMVAHHLENPSVFLKKAYDGLKFGGKLCLADLKKTEHPFHDRKQEGVVHDDGFEIEWIEKSLKESGFEKIEIYTATVIEKERGDEKLEFPVFLAVAEK